VTEQNNEQLVGTNRADALPKSWEPQAVEKDLYEGWVEKGYFTPDANSEAEPYSIVLPPPNVTGQLHMGHALDHTLIDSIIRRKRMQGYATLWLPGADHAGIATQTKVEAKLKETEGKKRWDYEREEFIDKVWNGRSSTAAPSRTRCAPSVTPWTGPASASPWMMASPAPSRPSLRTSTMRA